MKWTWTDTATAVAIAVGCAAGVVLARSAPVRYPIGDIALLEIYTREALAGRLLEGPYSHFPWHHPGPIYFYLLAPVYAAAGHKSASLNAGAAIVGLVSLGAVLWIAARSRSRWTAVIVAGWVLLYALRVDGLLVSAWNPHVVVLPLVVVLVAASAAAAGDGAMLPVLAAAGSFVVQTDLAVGPLVLVTTVVAAMACLRRRGLSKSALTAVVAITALLWTAPLIEQMTARAGNLSALWHFFVRSGSPGQTLEASLAAWSGMILAPLRRAILLPTGGALGEATSTEVVAAIGLTLATIAGAALAFRAGQRWLGWLAAMDALAAIVSFWSVTRIDGPITDHQIFWISIIGAVGLAALSSIVAGSLLPMRATAPIWMASVLQVALFGVAVQFTLSQMNRVHDGSAPVTVFLPSVGNFGDSIRRHLEATGTRRPLVRIDQPQWGVAAGILLQLQRLGIDVGVEESWAPMFPARLRETGREDLELTIAATGNGRQLSERPGDSLIDISTHVEVHSVARKH